MTEKQAVFIGPAQQTGPLGGTSESAAWFKAKLAEIGETAGSFSRVLQRLGDDRQLPAIRRALERMAAGDARVSGEMRVVLNLLARGRQNRAAARKADAAGVDEAP